VFGDVGVRAKCRGMVRGILKLRQHFLAGMANPRQRRKARSSSYKPVSHSLHAKKRMKKNPRASFLISGRVRLPCVYVCVYSYTRAQGVAGGMGQAQDGATKVRTRADVVVMGWMLMGGGIAMLHWDLCID
jgi:hypothetical protein